MEEFDCNELYRRVRNIPQYIKPDGNITSAVFKDSKGVSVDMDGGRTEGEIIKDEERLHRQQVKDLTPEEIINKGKNLKMIIAVEKNICEEKNVLVKSDPLEDNKYHAVMQRNQDVILLSESQAKTLARSARVVKRYYI